MEHSGWAFPVGEDNGVACGDPGMTLRDWFAAQALIGMLASTSNATAMPWTAFAQDAYAAADAMLVERSRKPKI